MDEIRAEREISTAGPNQRTRKETRLAYEIAWGIWLGGMALTVTNALIGLLFYKLVIGAIRLHFG